MKKPSKKKLHIYVLDHTISWEIFKLLQEKLIIDEGPTPEHGDRVLWEMLKDKQIYCWFDPEVPGDMGIGLELPKGKEIRVITNPKKAEEPTEPDPELMSTIEKGIGFGEDYKKPKKKK